MRINRHLAGAITNVNLLGGKNTDSVTNTGTITDNIAMDISSVSIYQFTHVIEKIADAGTENGAEQRVQQSYELPNQYG